MWLVAAGQLPAFRRRLAHARETVGEGAAALEAGGISLHVRDRIVREGKVARQVISFHVRYRIVREGTAKLEVKSRDRRQSDGESKDSGRANHVRGRAVLERRAADPFWVASQLKWGGAASKAARAADVQPQMRIFNRLNLAWTREKRAE